MSLPFAIMLMKCVPTFFQGPMSFDERKVIEGITLVKQYQGIILRITVVVYHLLGKAGVVFGNSGWKFWAYFQDVSKILEIFRSGTPK